MRDFEDNWAFLGIWTQGIHVGLFLLQPIKLLYIAMALLYLFILLTFWNFAYSQGFNLNPQQLFDLTFNRGGAQQSTKEELKIPNQFNKTQSLPIKINIKNNLKNGTKAVQTYKKIKQFAQKNNLPKKVLIKLPQKYLFLVLNADTDQLYLQRVQSQLLVQRLFSMDRNIMLVPDEMIRSMPMSKQPCESNSRLVKIRTKTKIKQSEQFEVFMLKMNLVSWTKHRVSLENIRQFGFSKGNIQQVSPSYLALFQNGDQFK